MRWTLPARGLHGARSMRSTCHIVPGLFALMLVPGCYSFHTTDAARCSAPAGTVCCDPDGWPRTTTVSGCPFACPAGTRLRDERECRMEPIPAPIDAGVPWSPPDAGPRDAGTLMCPLVRADATCLASFLVAPGVPFELPVTFDTCGCCIETECHVEVTSIGGAPTLLLTTTLCPDPCDCDACIIPEGRCAVPPLSEGAWNVVVNGAPAFTLPVFADSGLVPPPAACASYAEADGCSLSRAPIDPWGWRPSRVCVQETGGTESAVITAFSECWGCGDLHGPCIAALEPRFTDDLPPGGEIRLAPTTFPTACDVDCPGVCYPAERRCLVPRLTPGDFYRVWADGEAVLTFVAGESARVCSR